MKTITIFANSLKDAEVKQAKLYGQYDSVKLVMAPFDVSGSGQYMWKVE